MRRRLMPLVMMLAVTGALTGATGFSNGSAGDPARLGEDFDSRTTLPSIAPSAAQAKAIVALVRAPRSAPGHRRVLRVRDVCQHRPARDGVTA